MYFNCHHPSVRYSGRFAEVNGRMTATACGSAIEIAFVGEHILLEFDICGNIAPFPHLWLQLDKGCKTEVPLDKYIRLETAPGEHVLTILLKSAKETQQRFYHPLQGKLSFAGFTAENAGVLPADGRKTIEFVGDSITEGVLVEAPLTGASQNDQDNRPYQDDATATYAYLTAQNLGLRPLLMGYGAVGVTKGGNGSVPKAAEAYPYCFDGAPVTYPHPDYILINHGANDRKATAETYAAEYEHLLSVIRAAHPHAVIFCLSAFAGAHRETLGALIADYNARHHDNVHFIDSHGWVPADPLHPLRDGHKLISQKLTAALQKLL